MKLMAPFNQNILLINPMPGAPLWPTMPRAVEPMGLLYVGGAFKSAGCDVDILDEQLRFGHIELILARVAARKYDAAGIAIQDQSRLWNALRMAQDIKNLCPEMPVFAGGVFSSLNASWLLQTSPALDFVVVGEGEGFAMEFVRRKGRWKDIPHLACRHNAALAPALPVRLLTEPEVQPLRVMAPFVLERGEAVSVVASRGCTGGCTFCCVQGYYGSKWQARPVNHLMKELEDLIRRFHASRIYIVDDNMFASSSKARSWLEDFLVSASGLPGSPQFKTTCRLDDLDVSFLPAIKKGGFTLLKIGIETFCEETQRVYHKRISRDDAAQKIDRLHNAGIDTSLGFIMFDPYCRIADLRENLDFLLLYKNSWGRHLLRSALIVYNGTRINEQLERDGLVSSKSILGSTWRFRDPEVSRVYRRYDNLLREELLDIEYRLFNHQKALLDAHSAPRSMKELESLLKDCWISLFQRALDGCAVSSRDRGRLSDLAAAVNDYCKNGG
jgi:radical SAM superfamily enzyme YgiQ (UPF0313 family)